MQASLHNYSITVPTVTPRYQRPVWAFAKPGRSTQAASMLGMHHHFCHVDYAHMLGFLKGSMATNEQAFRILSRANSAETQRVYLLLDINTGNQVRPSRALWQVLEGLKRSNRIFYTNNEMLMGMARHIGLMVHMSTTTELRREGEPFTCLYIMKGQKRGQVTSMTRAIFEGQRIAARLY